MKPAFTILSIATVLASSPILGQSVTHTSGKTNFTEKSNMEKSNREKFSALEALNLPIDQYAITGSGPLEIRNLKAIGDIDIIVSEELWNKLASEYGVTDQNGVKKIVFPGGIVEAFHQGSFYSEPFDNKAPTYISRIANAEIIDGLSFDTLETILYYKKKEKRKKDLHDIELIENWIKKNERNKKN